jgi:tetratricopeptide (TPR) repeat protein
MATPITAFVARSFAKSDEIRIQPIIEHLNTFARFGFVCRSAEPAEAERVSDKVQRLIRDADLFVGFFTRKYPVYPENGLAAEIAELSSPSKWVPPPWVLQESGCAVALGKKLIFFKEVGVEIPELQGDLEFIEFDPSNLAEALRKTNEMILGIIAKGMAIEIQTTVQQEVQSPPPQHSPAVVEKPESQAELSTYIYRFIDALEQRDTARVNDAFECGLEYATANLPHRVLHWKILTARFKFECGYPDGWQELKDLQAADAEAWEVDVAVAYCLRKSGEFAEAAKTYQAAADKAPATKKTPLLISEAEALQEGKQWDEARRLLLSSLDLATPQQRLDVLRAMYLNLKSTSSKFEAFGVGELCVGENNAQPDFHFTLGYDYAESDLGELSVFHYQMALDQQAKDAAALNNLGVAYAALEMPGYSVRYHLESSKLGSTLAAGNLAYKYIEGGMTEDAGRILEDAGKIPDHDVVVDQAQAELKRRAEAENTKEKEIRDLALRQKAFLKKLGHAYVTARKPSIDGEWSFPSFDMSLRLSGSNVVGTGRKTVTSGRWNTLFGGTTEVPRTEGYALAGNLNGRICKFSMTLDSNVDSSLGSITHKEGYIVFEDGDTASVMETEPKRELYSISRQSVEGALGAPA